MHGSCALDQGPTLPPPPKSRQTHLHPQLVQHPDSVPPSWPSRYRHAVLRQCVAPWLVGCRKVDWNLDTILWYEAHYPILSASHHKSVFRDHLLILKVDICVQVCALPPCKLSLPVPCVYATRHLVLQNGKQKSVTSSGKQRKSVKRPLKIWGGDKRGLLHGVIGAVCACVRACMRVCVKERERERER
jgi:hypothetical protein